MLVTTSLIPFSMGKGIRPLEKARVGLDSSRPSFIMFEFALVYFLEMLSGTYAETMKLGASTTH